MVLYTSLSRKGQQVTACLKLLLLAIAAHCSDATEWHDHDCVYIVLNKEPHLPSKHETSTQCCNNVGPPSATLAQHCYNIGSTSRVCRVVQVRYVTSLNARTNWTGSTLIDIPTCYHHRQNASSASPTHDILSDYTWIRRWVLMQYWN